MPTTLTMTTRRTGVMGGWGHQGSEGGEKGKGGGGGENSCRRDRPIEGSTRGPCEPKKQFVALAQYY